VLTAKQYYQLGFCLYSFDKSQSPIFKVIRMPALRQSGMKLKYVTIRPPSPPNLMFHFLKSS